MTVTEQQQVITIVNISVPNMWTSKYIKQTKIISKKRGRKWFSKYLEILKPCFPHWGGHSDCELIKKQ